MNYKIFKQRCLANERLEPTENDNVIIQSICRFCNGALTEETFDSYHTYWRQCLAPCHLACKKSGVREEQIECQKIDADCNDCRFFKRGKVLQTGQASIIDGHCLKFDKPTLAYPNFSRGLDCFEHRRDHTKK